MSFVSTTKMLKSFKMCILISLEILEFFPMFKLIGMVLIPFMVSFLNNMINTLIITSPNNILKCIVLKFCYDYISLIVQNGVFYSLVREMSCDFITRLNIAKIKCGVPIPGINQKHHKDILHDQSKLRDFLFVIPMFWSTIVNFSISIYMMEVSDVYPIRFLFACFCIFMCSLLTYITDSTVYEKTKPSSLSITNFDDSQYVKMKMSMDCNIDIDFEKNKRNKIMKQRNIQKYIIILINLVITYISLISNSIKIFHSFGNISWMIGCLSDNLKSFQYYTYMIELIKLTKSFEYHSLKCNGIIPIGKIDKIEFVNASFGYYDNDLMKNPSKTPKIINLSYVFNCGVFYYLEAPNGIGKSTILKMFTSNLFSGDIYFGNINRKHLSFEDIRTSVFHIVQASEYTPKFSLEEIKSYKNRDKWLEERLGLSDLFEKDTVEMSGGQKKRMFIYIVMTSSSTLLLLDEILSELSTEETPDIPEGGGWLSRVINTLIEWKGRKNKIIILVGHGLIHLIPNKPNIIKLKLSNENNETILSSR